MEKPTQPVPKNKKSRNPAVTFVLVCLTLTACAFAGFWGMLFIVFTGRAEIAVPALLIFLLAVPFLLFSRFKKNIGMDNGGRLAHRRRALRILCRENV